MTNIHDTQVQNGPGQAMSIKRSQALVWYYFSITGKQAFNTCILRSKISKQLGKYRLFFRPYSVGVSFCLHPGFSVFDSH